MILQYANYSIHLFDHLTLMLKQTSRKLQPNLSYVCPEYFWRYNTKHQLFGGHVLW